MEKATFAAGCFWGIEDALAQVPGVIQTAVGYMGGETANPSYREVCSGDTGHAEVVQIVFDPEQVGYHDLLDLFWQIHDPTQVNRQGPDVGTQYRSAIFVADEGQRSAAEASREAQKASGRYSRPIATQIEPAGDFWRAEEYHQQYFAKRGIAGCQI